MRELIDSKRPEIVQRVATARAEGDLRENFAYHDAGATWAFSTAAYRPSKGCSGMH
jgi:transcription elongation GreA/GreB family factor